MLRLPSLITCAGLVCGFVGLLFAVRHDFGRAALLVGIAALLDALDGLFARRRGSECEFGTNLDSLADLVSFGVVPALALYLQALHRLEGLGVAASAAFVVCGALRLARFPLVKSDRWFVGLPIPPAGVALAALCVVEPPPLAAALAAAGLAALMVSRLPFPTLAGLAALGRGRTSRFAGRPD
ncbi:CDP-diacylglycerol--serine O-phosphatidyltransferase [Rubrobacter xylanophilus]|nr:CDP-diacylglycerol--serine O-phosphatidyltransferase [Rubrobacter xylanophilus]